MSDILKYMDDLHVNGKVVLLRVDFNVPMKGGVIVDDRRITEHLPTIKELLHKGAKVVLMSHLGRPEGSVDERYSLAPVATHLAQLLGQPVPLMKSHAGADVAFKVQSMSKGSAIMLPNLRFDPGEEKNDAAFAHKLASLADIYINDAFATAHREHASTVGVTTFFKERGVGRLMQKEIDMLNGVLTAPAHPFVVVVGGAKAETKLPVIKSLLEKADFMLVGGAIANVLLYVSGKHIGASPYESDQVALAKDILHWAERDNCHLMLPVDVVVADKLETYSYTMVKEMAPKDTSTLTPQDIIFDIGPKTVAQWKNLIDSAHTVLWNGPCGAFEHPPFNAGTMAIAQAIAGSAAFSICGGGDTLSAVQNPQLTAGFNYLSTGGGAMLEFLKGKSLPGIRALSYGSKNSQPSLSDRNFNRFLK